MNSTLDTFAHLSVLLTPPENTPEPEDKPTPQTRVRKDDLYNKDKPYYRKKPLKQIFKMKNKKK
jgi:hypothetical protein